MIEKFTYFDNEEVLLDHMIEDFGDTVSLVGDYELIEELFMSLLLDYGYEIDMLEIDRCTYDREYMLQIDNEKCSFSVEKAYVKNIDRYITTSGAIYVNDEVNSKCIRDMQDNDSVKPIIIPFTFDFDLYQLISEEENEQDNYKDDGELKSCFDFDDDNCGFTYCQCLDGNKTRFTYKGKKPLTKDMAWEIIKSHLDF